MRPKQYTKLFLREGREYPVHRDQAMVLGRGFSLPRLILTPSSGERGRSGG